MSVTYYCPSCWQQLPENAEACPYCGEDMSSLNDRRYEEKLVSATSHPVAETRHMAVQVLAMLRTPRALDAFAHILHEEKNDVYLLFLVLEALAEIPSPANVTLLKEATSHPYRLVRKKAQECLRHADDLNSRASA